MAATVDRDDPGVVDHLDEHDDVIRRLENLVVVVVEAGRHRTRHAARQTPVVRAEILPRIESLVGERAALVSPALGRRRGQRRVAPVGRVDDQGRS